MKWIHDRSGRFGKKPHYERGELDSECEKLIVAFLQERYSRIEFPISTEDLCLLIEKRVEDLDIYADLPQDTFGLTEFRPGGKASVRVSRLLSEDPRMANPLRTTLTHELGHVTFHGFLFELGSSNLELFDHASSPKTRECRRQNIIAAPETDWMEWQAGYACGAILMPATYLRNSLRRVLGSGQALLPLPAEEAGGLLQEVMTSFSVSAEAAKVRLSQLGYLTDKAVSLPIKWG